MNKLYRIVLILICSLLFDCKNKREVGSNKIPSVTEVKNSSQNELAEINDSLYLDNILTNALKLADNRSNEAQFETKYYEIRHDSAYQVEVFLSKDFHFVEDKPHLIIKRNAAGFLYTEIFKIDESDFEEILSTEQWMLTEPKDSIFDANKDGVNDFAINGYGVNGCCLKAFSKVYLYDEKHNSFSREFRFLNPTFFESSKIIRGVKYGHPKHTSLYKYKWDKMTIDTLEYVSYDRDTLNKLTGKILIQDKNYTLIKTLYSVPNEYHSIFGYDWFTGDVLND